MTFSRLLRNGAAILSIALLVVGGISAFAQRVESNVPSGISVSRDLGLADSAALAALVWMLAMLAATLVAQPSAALALLLVCGLFTVLNITIERLLGAWVEKLLAKRKSREIFFTIFVLAMVSLQFLNPLM